MNQKTIALLVLLAGLFCLVKNEVGLGALLIFLGTYLSLSQR
jgi:hypothetical protein